MDIYSYWLMEKAAQEVEAEEMYKIAAGKQGFTERTARKAGKKIDQAAAAIKGYAGRAWKKTKDMTRAGYGKVRGGTKAVGSHLWRQKGRYGFGTAAAGLGYGAYAAGREDR